MGGSGGEVQTSIWNRSARGLGEFQTKGAPFDRTENEGSLLSASHLNPKRDPDKRPIKS